MGNSLQAFGRFQRKKRAVVLKLCVQTLSLNQNTHTHLNKQMELLVIVHQNQNK